jgi:hypothetical protein
MNWNIQFQKTTANIQVVGFIAASEEECHQFFIDRVTAKLAESDGKEELRQHLIELETTGFDLNGLSSQLTESPATKDWEIGEAFAEIALEDRHEAMFPWPTNFDKRTPNASLPGADLIGLQRLTAPRFVFGEVKSSSENRIPPQVVDTADGCLAKQIYQLRHRPANREQLIAWLMQRMRGTDWENAFNEALQRYAQGDWWLVGILVSGKRKADENDLISICRDINHQPGNGNIDLLGFYLPFHKDEWCDIISGKVALS